MVIVIQKYGSGGKLDFTIELHRDPILKVLSEWQKWFWTPNVINIYGLQFDFMQKKSKETLKKSESLILQCKFGSQAQKWPKSPKKRIT